MFIDFHDNATDEERAVVRRIAEEQPLVERIELDVALSALPSRTLDELRQE